MRKAAVCRGGLAGLEASSMLMSRRIQIKTADLHFRCVWYMGCDFDLNDNRELVFTMNYVILLGKQREVVVSIVGKDMRKMMQDQISTRQMNTMNKSLHSAYNSIVNAV